MKLLYILSTLPLLAFAARYVYHNFPNQALSCEVKPYAIAFMAELFHQLKRDITTAFSCTLALEAQKILSEASNMTHLEKHQADRFYRKFTKSRPDPDVLAANVTYMFEDSNLTAIGCDYLMRNGNGTETTFYVYCIVGNDLRNQ